MPVQGFLKHFRAEFEYHVEHGRCRANRRRTRGGTRDSGYGQPGAAPAPGVTR